MEVKQIVNSVFKSNTYIISKARSNCTWLIDIGEIDGVLSCLSADKIIKGAFITHSHFDHIYGINKLIDKFPQCIIYTSEQGKEGLYSEKVNLSYYHDDPVIFRGSNIHILNEGDKVELFHDIYLETLETPGHDWSCLTYKIDNYLFTGDSFIPKVKVVTKLKGGNLEESGKSLRKIIDNISDDTVICPGHNVMVKELKENIEIL
jgi:hydroxyacylglutathione hydrolase